MELKHSFEHPEGEMEVYVNASDRELKYLTGFALQYHVMNDLFPFQLVKDNEMCYYHTMPETVQ